MWGGGANEKSAISELDLMLNESDINKWIMLSQLGHPEAKQLYVTEGVNET
ncbi:MAG TPA: hypothetical protein VK097_06305 [Lentibacillus sp.]|nr:hypothetical protein [Lentibacillus sp.]